MKIMNNDTYDIAYSSHAYENIEDYSDLIFALVNDYEIACERFHKEFKFDKRKKKLDGSKEQEALHAVATQVEVGLDSSIQQFYARLLDPDKEFMNEKYFKTEFIKKNESKTPANSLGNKLSALKKFISSFQQRYKLELRRSFRYSHSRLYYAQSKYITFKKDSFPGALLAVLFDDIAEVYDNDKLIEIIAYSYKYLNISLDTEDLGKLKKACEHINKRVSEETKSRTKLILHNIQNTSLNPFAFDHIDRVQFDRNR